MRRINTISLDAGGPVGVQLDRALAPGTLVTTDQQGVPEILTLGDRSLWIALNTRAMEIWAAGKPQLRRVQLHPSDLHDYIETMQVWLADGGGE